MAARPKGKGQRRKESRVAVNRKTEIARARAQGEAAFHNGLDRTPVLDPALWPMWESKEVGEGLPITKAWLLGWDLANLAAPW